MTNVIFSGNKANDLGGGLNNQGEATLTTVTFTGNETSGSTGGAGIYNAGNLQVNSCTFRQNLATNNGDGAAIHNIATAHITGMSADHNTASGEGGAIHNFKPGEIFVAESIFSYNSGAMGGAVSNNGGQITLSVVTLDHNNAQYSGGAIMNNNFATLDLVNVTISANAAVDLGGGIANGGADAYLYAVNVTIAENTAQNLFSSVATNGAGLYHLSGTVMFINVLLADNQGSNCGGQPFTGSGMNLSTDASCAFDGNGNITNVDAMLDPLASLDGSMPVHALHAGSPAIDTGTEWTAPDFDQRGLIRPIDGDNDGIARVDIGAFEFAYQLMSGQADPQTPGPLTFELLEDASCRSGPGVVYPVLAYAASGERVPAEGRNENMSWFQVQVGGNMLCWISGDLGRLSGDPAWLPVRVAPPTPIPVLPGPSDTPGPQLSCSAYTSLETCIGNGCKWLDGGCHNP
jgi:hypothetical protein